MFIYLLHPGGKRTLNNDVSRITEGRDLETHNDLCRIYVHTNAVLYNWPPFCYFSGSQRHCTAGQSPKQCSGHKLCNRRVKKRALKHRIWLSHAAANCLCTYIAQRPTFKVRPCSIAPACRSHGATTSQNCSGPSCGSIVPRAAALVVPSFAIRV